MFNVVRRTFVAVVLLFTALSQVSTAQQLYARIRGTVVDPSGAAVPGAQVKATNVDTGFNRTVKSESNGSYELLELPVGRYVVSTESPNFKAFQTTPISLTVNEIYNLPIQL